MASGPKPAPEGYRADYYSHLRKLDRVKHETNIKPSNSRVKQSGEPKGFWTSIVYEYIANNPGCSQNAAACSLIPHRSSGLGVMIIRRLIKQELIVAFRGPRSFLLYIKDHEPKDAD